MPTTSNVRLKSGRVHLGQKSKSQKPMPFCMATTRRPWVTTDEKVSCPRCLAAMSAWVMEAVDDERREEVKQ